ncbi:unnamed protein product [Moneuplotes crassus]|uniref:ribonucleoside-triphosphate reductase (thioredoxin) n=1 Tax=Euplotes crassus TaxID=5936 RepID=A0AAD1U5H1_EUPCR|nr:unnamed protein product [Moneuplotes crassus]
MNRLGNSVFKIRHANRVKGYRSGTQSALRSFSTGFKLPNEFLDRYRDQKVNFGFNGLGEIAYIRTYSRKKEDGTNEQWADTVERIVNGCFSMMNEFAPNAMFEEMQTINAMRMYDKIYNFKFLPPGRGIWAMGSQITQKKKLYTALNNCAFVSTKLQPGVKNTLPFTFLMDSSMLGVGVGFDTKGSGSMRVFQPIQDKFLEYVIPDTREGWVKSVELLLDSYFEEGKPKVKFDYSQIRQKGLPLKTFGGVSSGPEPLMHLHEMLENKLSNSLPGGTLNVRDIVDIMNFIGKCVVAGNIRRSAEIAMGEFNDKEFIQLKNYDKYPERMDYGWVSNNSILAKTGMNYSTAVENILSNGEPGFAWLENMQNYGRMVDPADYKDTKACGGNPCLEQTLESFEMCTLVETFPNHHSSFDDFKDTLELAFLYAKIVTLGLTHWSETNEVMERNRRIGCSMSGIAQFVSDRGLETLRKTCDQGYNYLREYDSYISKQFDVPESIKITSIKPSGTVSLLAGATPGMHFPESQYYIRRVRLSKHNALVPILQEAGYRIEDDVYTPNTVCVEVPVDLGPKIRTLENVSLWEQLSLASFLQKYWADNQVSCTVSFDPETEKDQIEPALNYFQYQLKGVSFLPKAAGSYKQMPYEKIDSTKYEDISSKITPVELSKKLSESEGIFEDTEGEKYCDSSSCQIG